MTLHTLRFRARDDAFLDEEPEAEDAEPGGDALRAGYHRLPWRAHAPDKETAQVPVHAAALGLLARWDAVAWMRESWGKGNKKPRSQRLWCRRGGNKSQLMDASEGQGRRFFLGL
jgi:hypothetical protein